jgi:hypothetical protein
MIDVIQLEVEHSLPNLMTRTNYAKTPVTRKARPKTGRCNFKFGRMRVQPLPPKTRAIGTILQVSYPFAMLNHWHIELASVSDQEYQIDDT